MMKNRLSEEDLFSNLKMLVFKHNDKSVENLQALFTLAKSLNDIETIKVLAKKYFFMDAILFLDNLDHDLNIPDLIELITENAGYDAIKKAIDQGSYINKKDTYSNTALIKASILNEVDIVKLLLQYKANVHDKLKNASRLVESVFKLGYKEVLDLLIQHGADDILNEYAESFFHDVDKQITSQFIAEQFVHEELDAARQGNDEAKHFVAKSGVKEELYLDAMRRSLPEVDGANSPQQILVFHCLWPIMNDDNRDLIAKIRILTVQKVMNKYRIGKYEKKITKLTLENNSPVYIHHNHAVIDDERFELIDKNKYYHQNRKIYLEMLNNAVAFSRMTYDNEEKKEYFSVVAQEDILKYYVKHNPKRLVEILNFFTKDNPIKYTAHSFDWTRYGTYENFMKEVEKTFETIEDDLKDLSPNLYEKISKFLFSNQINHSNTWGISRIGFGWSSHQLKEWSHLEESKLDGKKAIYFPLPEEHIKVVNGKTISTFDDVCNVFKNEIEIRDDGKLSMLLEDLEEEILGFDYEVEYKNIENISFYTDVEYLRYGLSKIFEQFKEDHRKTYNYIVIEALSCDKGKYVDLILTQIGSEATKNSEMMKQEIEDGDFKDIKNYFSSLCDWSIIAKYKNECFSIDYLSTGTENTASDSEPEPEGFTHRLRFYK